VDVVVVDSTGTVSTGDGVGIVVRAATFEIGNAFGHVFHLEDGAETGIIGADIYRGSWRLKKRTCRQLKNW
jgi:hypothetical protein